MDFLNKAKQAAEKYAGGSGSNNNASEKKEESVFTKAMGAAEKYHVKDKAVQYAQKRVEERKLHPESKKKDESVVDKAVVAAEDFLAKQGQPQSQSPAQHSDQKDNQMGDLFGKAKEAAEKYSKKH